MWPFKKLKKPLYVVQCFQGLEGPAGWRFRIESAYNAQPIATSESYDDRWNMERTAKSVGKEAGWQVRGLNEDFPKV
jgi:uncharacterized protein YegP (UPF0339 family)